MIRFKGDRVFTNVCKTYDFLCRLDRSLVYLQSVIVSLYASGAPPSEFPRAAAKRGVEVALPSHNDMDFDFWQDYVLPSSLGSLQYSL